MRVRWVFTVREAHGRKHRLNVFRRSAGVTVDLRAEAIARERHLNLVPLLLVGKALPPISGQFSLGGDLLSSFLLLGLTALLAARIDSTCTFQELRPRCQIVGPKTQIESIGTVWSDGGAAQAAVRRETLRN